MSERADEPSGSASAPTVTHGPAASSIAIGVWIAALLPLVWLMPALHAHEPFVQAGWEVSVERFAFGLQPLRRGLEALCTFAPFGSQALRTSLAAALSISAVSAALYVWIELLLRRVLPLISALRAPIALGVAWAIASRLLIAEPVLARLIPYAPGVALALACLAQRAALTRAPHLLRALAQLAFVWLLTLLEQPLLAILIAPALAPVIRLLRGIEPVSELVRRAVTVVDSPSHQKPAPRLMLAAALTFMVLCGALLREGANAVSALRSEAFDALRDALLHDAAPRAGLVLHPSISYPLWRSRAALRVRADVRLVPSAALLEPRTAERLANAHPELKSLVRASLLRGALDPIELQTLAATRAVHLTPELETFVAVRETLLPGALGFEVTTSSATSADLKAAWASSEGARARLFAQLDPAQLDPATRAFVREHCVLNAALLSGLQRGAVLSEQLDRAASFATNPEERDALASALTIVGIPAGASPR